MANKFLHIIGAAVFVGLLFVLSDPLMFFMPKPAQMLALLAVAVLAILWAGFVMYEKTNDERELVHKMEAGRIAYISGITILTIALVFQGLNHKIDGWVSLALSFMVVSKLLARWYFEKYK